MFNDATLTMTGNVASDPEYKLVGEGIPVLKLRVAWNSRRRDPVTGDWVDANSSFATVTCWRKLAVNLRSCLRKGDPVFLRGKMDIRQWVTKDGQPRTTVEVEADTLGYNLVRGVASFQKTTESPGKTAAELEAEAARAAEVAAGNGRAITAGGGGEPISDADLAELSAGPEADEIFNESAVDALAQEAAAAAAAS